MTPLEFSTLKLGTPVSTEFRGEQVTARVTSIVQRVARVEMKRPKPRKPLTWWVKCEEIFHTECDWE